MKAIRSMIGALMLAALAGGAWAQANVIDGSAWLQSTERERIAFVMGVTHMIAVEKAYAEREGLAEPPAGAQFAQQTGNLTVEQVAERITRWYQTHPDEQKTPVMKVVWLDLVRSGVARK